MVGPLPSQEQASPPTVTAERASVMEYVIFFTSVMHPAFVGCNMTAGSRSPLGGAGWKWQRGGSPGRYHRPSSSAPFARQSTSRRGTHEPDKAGASRQGSRRRKEGRRGRRGLA